MLIAMIGLGRTGANMVRRLLKNGQACVVYARKAEAIAEDVLTPVLGAALYERFSSRGEGGFANRVLSAMRQDFGGHAEKPTEKPAQGAR